MCASETVDLPGGQKLDVRILTYPLAEPDQRLLIQLKQQEWDRTDVDWLTSMRGDHSESLTTRVAIGLFEKVAIGTATVAYPVHSPELCIIEDVVTSKHIRGRGIGAALTDLMVKLGFAAGCRVAYLGNTPLPGGSVYEKIGFERIAGAIMRRAVPEAEGYEESLYRPGQDTRIRPAEWGDLPALVCLMSQQMNCLLVDYPRGLVSSRSIAPVRAVSNFTSVKYETQDRGGVMISLIGESAHRVLGFGSLTPGLPPLRSHTAIMDVAVHDNYRDKAPGLISHLLELARNRRLKQLEFYQAEGDEEKAFWFTREGFKQVAVLPNHLHLGEKTCDIQLFHYTF